MPKTDCFAVWDVFNYGITNDEASFLNEAFLFYIAIA